MTRGRAVALLSGGMDSATAAAIAAADGWEIHALAVDSTGLVHGWHPSERYRVPLP